MKKQLWEKHHNSIFKMSENTDIVVSNVRRHKLTKRQLLLHQKVQLSWVGGGVQKREMEKNKYIMFSMNKTGEEVEALETSIKEKKKKKVAPLEGYEWKVSEMVFFPPFSSQFYSAFEFQLLPDIKWTPLIFHLLPHAIKLSENKHYSINQQGFLFLNNCGSPTFYSDVTPN